MASIEKIEVKEGVDQETVDAVREVGGAYKYGWETDIEMEYAPKGMNAVIVKLISDKNEEPDWMTDWRMKAFNRWEKIKNQCGQWLNIQQLIFRTSIITPDRNL